jgi:methyltransferase-like protein 6
MVQEAPTENSIISLCNSEVETWQTEYAEMLVSQNDPTRAPSTFQRTKLIKETARNWDLFYKRHTTNFFKDRHWTQDEFSELMPSDMNQKVTLLEVGCGVGNFVFPLLKANPNLFIYCCDFSQRAVGFVKDAAEYEADRCHAFVCDLTCHPLTDTITEQIDLISAIFVLSAIPPSKLRDAISNLHSVLKPGGIVLFRDYGFFDTAQLRFKAENKLDEGFYARTDGTFSVFFTPENISAAFSDASFEVVECGYVEKEIVNRKQETTLNRKFVQGRFRKL